MIVGLSPLYKAVIPSVRAMFKPIINIFISILLICTRLLITSAGKMAVHRQIPPTDPAAIVRNNPMSSFFWFGLLRERKPNFTISTRFKISFERNNQKFEIIILTVVIIPLFLHNHQRSKNSQAFHVPSLVPILYKNRLCLLAWKFVVSTVMA